MQAQSHRKAEASETLPETPGTRATFTAGDCFIAALATGLFSVLILPMLLFLNNQLEFYSTSLMMLFLLSLSGLLVSVLIFGVLLLVGQRLRSLFIPLLAFILLAAWVQSQFLNWHYGSFDGSPLDITLKDWRTADLIVWFLCALICIFLRIKRPRLFRGVFLVLLFLNLGNLAASYARPEEAVPVVEEAAEVSVSWVNAFSFSQKKNVIVLLLDAFQSDYFNEYLETHPEYAEKLPGFTYYPDTLATDYYTHRCLPVIMTGRHFKYETSYNSYVSENYGSKSLPARFREAGYSVGIYNYFTLAQSMYRPNLLEQLADNYTREAEAFTPYYGKEIRKLLYTALFQGLPHALKNRVYTSRILAVTEELDRDRFRQTLKEERRLAFSEPRFTFYHLQGLHDPLILDGKRVLDHRENVSSITEIMAELIIDFTGSLQKLGIYDSTSLLILGDHGLQWKQSNMKFGSFSSEKATTDPPLDLFAKKVRALPMLLFKPPHSKEAFQVSRRRVSLMDVVPTLLDSADLPFEGDYEGQSLLASETPDRVRSFFSSEYTKRGSAALYEYAVSDFAWYDASWHFTGNTYSSKGLVRTIIEDCVPGRQYQLGRAGNGLQFLDAFWSATGEGHSLEGRRGSLTLPLAEAGAQYALTLHFIAKGEARLRVTANKKELGAYHLAGQSAVTLDIVPDMIRKTREGVAPSKPPEKAHLAPVPQPSAHDLILDLEIGEGQGIILTGFVLEKR